MLFGYPIAATTENWLHDCLFEILTAIHTHLDDGVPLAKWPDIIPEAHRDALRNRTGLRDRVDAYHTAVSGLTPHERQQIAACLKQQNRIGQLCTCVEDCELLNQLPPQSHESIRSLFDFGFSLLTELGVRDRHYGKIYSATPYHVCPFCGSEYFDAPGAPREDVDHYFPKSRYPFAAVNLRNLVPMGMRCNERYKLDADILRNADGTRRRVFDPYAEGKVEVRMNASVPFAGADGQTPKWAIQFEPDTPECTTWDEVFHVRERIQRDVLDPSFFRWLRDFAAWFKKRIANPEPDAEIVQHAMLQYAEDLTLLGFSAREFLRAPVFRMLHFHCTSGNDRLNTLMIELVSMKGAN